MSEYLDVTGIISFDEFVDALNQGKLSKQLTALKQDYFPNQHFCDAILESVRVDIEHNCFRIVPSFRKCIKETQGYNDKKVMDTEARSFVPPVPARANSLCRLRPGQPRSASDSIKHGEKKRDQVLNNLKSKASQKQYFERKLVENHGVRKPAGEPAARLSKTKPIPSPLKSSNEKELSKLQKALTGNVQKQKVGTDVRLVPVVHAFYCKTFTYKKWTWIGSPNLGLSIKDSPRLYFF